MIRPEPEKREFPRLEATLQMDVRTKYIYTTGSMLNVSANGLFVKTMNPIPEGTEIELVTHLPNLKRPLRFKGVVRWVRKKDAGSSCPAGMGIQLILPDAKLVRRLTKAIQQLPKAL
jgi:uncharacterized protein (TIGR02266 family)